MMDELFRCEVLACQVASDKLVRRPPPRRFSPTGAVAAKLEERAGQVDQLQEPLSRLGQSSEEDGRGC